MTHEDDALPLQRSLALLLIALALVGCETLQERKKESALNATLYSYHTAMRWGHWETLFSYRDAKSPEVPELDLDNIRVTSYEVRQPPVEVKEGTVMQVVEIQYVLTDRQRLKKLLDKQEWRHEKETKLWRIHSPFPDFKDK